MSRDRFNYDMDRNDLDFVERKKRQQLRESNVEIRDLEAKLRQAYVNRALAVQVKQKELADQQEKADREADHHQQEVVRLQAMEAERLEEQKAKVESLRLQKSLDAQMAERQKVQESDFQQFLVEKKLIDEIIAKVKEEERARMVDAMRKKQVEADTIREFVESQKVWAELESRRNDEENREIIAFINKKDQWRNEQDTIAKDRRSLKNESVLRLASSMHSRQKEEDERVRLMHELYCGRMEEGERVSEREEVEREVRRRMNLRQSNDLAREVRRRQLEATKQEEEAWKKKCAEEYEREAKLEQMSDQKRRMKRLEFQREAARNVEERRAVKEAEARAEAQFWRHQREQQAANEQAIEAERVRLLREHAKRLIGFMPPGLINSKDLEMLADEDITLLYKPSAAKDPLEEIEQYYERLNKKNTSYFQKNK